MRGLCSSTARCVLFLALAMSARADQPITFDLHESLELSGKQKLPGSSLRLEQLDPGARKTGLDGLLAKVSGGDIKMDTIARQLRTPPSPAVQPPRRAPAKAPAPPDKAMRLTTRLDVGARPIGEFKTRDWNALGDVRALAALGADLTAPTPAAKLQLGSISVELPPIKASKVTEASDITPAAMARAQDSLTVARTAGMKPAKPRTSSEPLLVLPDFGTSSFQVGASFSLSGKPLGSIGFSEKLLEPEGANTLRLNDAEPVESKPRKGDDGRLWTGVVFNF
jgi:hypothetical protein